MGRWWGGGLVKAGQGCCGVLPAKLGAGWSMADRRRRSSGALGWIVGLFCLFGFCGPLRSSRKLRLPRRQENIGMETQKKPSGSEFPCSASKRRKREQKCSHSQEKQATVRQQCKWEMELRPCSPRVDPGTPAQHTSAHFRTLPHTSAHSNPHTSAHFRTLPHTSAHMGCAHRHTRTLPHTSAHFRTLPHTWGARTDTPAHFRTLPRTSAHFRSDPLTPANMLRRLRCGTFAAGGILLSVFEDFEKNVRIHRNSAIFAEFPNWTNITENFPLLPSLCLRSSGLFSFLRLPNSQESWAKCETCKKCWGKNVGDHCCQIHFL